MLWLTGMVGAMLLGSVAVIGVMPAQDDDLDEVAGSGADQGGDEVAPLPHVSEDPVTVDTGAPEPGAEHAAPPARQSSEGGLIAAGSLSDDILGGTGWTDQLYGDEGTDVILGRGGDDELLGGAGADLIEGGAANDTLHGEAGSDTLLGGDGADSLFAHGGGGEMRGGGGDDEMHGGTSADRLRGDAGDDALHGREGADTLAGGDGTDTLFGGAGNDLLDGRDDRGADFLNGGPGDDTLLAGAGDVITGSDGADVLMFGGWSTGGAAEVMDFDPVEDQLVVFYDETGAVPELAVDADPDDPEMSRLSVDGEVVAVLPAADMPAIEAIALLPQTLAPEVPA